MKKTKTAVSQLPASMERTDNSHWCRIYSQQATVAVGKMRITHFINFDDMFISPGVSYSIPSHWHLKNKKDSGLRLESDQLSFI